MLATSWSAVHSPSNVRLPNQRTQQGIGKVLVEQEHNHPVDIPVQTEKQTDDHLLRTTQLVHYLLVVQYADYRHRNVDGIRQQHRQRRRRVAGADVADLPQGVDVHITQFIVVA